MVFYAKDEREICNEAHSDLLGERSEPSHLWWEEKAILSQSYRRGNYRRYQGMTCNDANADNEDDDSDDYSDGEEDDKDYHVDDILTCFLMKSNFSLCNT